MNSIIPIEQNNQRVLLTSQLAESYGTESQVITNNFNRNKTRYQEGRHYFALEGDVKRSFINQTQIDLGSAANAKTLYLWTEKGALLHAKSLNTDRAWEVYDELVETYFKAQEIKTSLSELSPQLQLLINLEVQQKRQQQELEAVNQRLDNIRDVAVFNPTSWRKEARHLISGIAQAMGGMGYMPSVNAEIYNLLEDRAKVRLHTRLTNKRRVMADNGVCKSKRDKLNKMDVIADDAKLIEIYVAIVKEMAIKYGVGLQEAQKGA